jgi:hypothetical protein
VCLLLACGGSGPVVHADGAAIDGDVHDGAIEQATPPLPDAASDPSGGEKGQEERDGSPDVVAMDGPVETPPDGPRETPPDAPVEAPPDGPTTCAVYCNDLPHVLPGTVVGCDDAGVCELPNPAPCEDGFAHCSANPNDGCETDLSSPHNCGRCDAVCSASYGHPVCTRQNGIYYCSPICVAPTPDTCGATCVDLQTDLGNCGSCGNACLGDNAVMACTQGQCALVQCIDALFAHCPGDTTCETRLETDANCAGCGDKACALANTVLTCSSANDCATAICAPGYGNCDTSTPDCEASFTTGAACLPGYLGTAVFAGQSVTASTAVIAADGSYFVAGNFSGSVDFDPTPGQDIHTATGGDGFITKLNADGSYSWTRTFDGGSIRMKGLAAAANGAVVATGIYQVSVDLDPGTGVDLQQTTEFNGDGFVVKLDAGGSFVWGGTFAGTSAYTTVEPVQVAVDGTDAVYVAGYFLGTVDFDPGPGTAARTATQPSGYAGMVVKLTAEGAFAWVQSVNNFPDGCSATLNSVAVATDGSVWSVGSATTVSPCLLGAPSATGPGLIVSYTPSGAARGMWFFGGYADSVAAGPEGSVYIGGMTDGIADFDPGPGEVKRLFPTDGGFILKLGADASFNWVQTVLDVVSINWVAGTSDGGVLAAAANNLSPFVTELNSDGTSGWTFVSGEGGTVLQAVTAGGGNFALAGFNLDGSVDFDPGAGMDIASGPFGYLSRFSF